MGYIIAGIKELQAAKVGDTVTLIKAGTGGAAATATEALPGFKEIQPQVFAGLYPTEANQYDSLRDALEKLKLNDASLHYEPEVSQALGFGFRCGFLGLLHMEIVQERLEREFDQDLITTAPSVVYQVAQGRRRGDHGGEPVQDARRRARSTEIREPIVTVHLYMPQEYVGAGHDAGQPEARRADEHGLPRPPGHADLRAAAGRDRAGLLRQAEVGQPRLRLDGLRRSRSIAPPTWSRSTSCSTARRSTRCRSSCTAASRQYRGRAVVAKMREIISRQMFDVAIQAAIGANIIARETIKALRKNVLAKCYGGDISRKRKLLEKQKAGKKRMKQIGSVEVPQEAFLAILQVEE